MMTNKVTILLMLMFFSSIFAQQVTKRDTISGTPFSINMDARIESGLDNLEESCTRKTAKTNRPDYNDDAPDYTPSTPKSNTPAKIYVPSRALTTAEICRKSPRIAGYKIQLVVVKSNDEANKVKDYFRNRYPSIKAQTDASLRPNYKILAGSYFSKQSAASDLAIIRKTFKSAIVVPYSIFCVEGK